MADLGQAHTCVSGPQADRLEDGWLCWPKLECLLSAPCGCSSSCRLTWPAPKCGGSNPKEGAEELLVPKLRTETPFSHILLGKQVRFNGKREGPRLYLLMGRTAKSHCKVHGYRERNSWDYFATNLHKTRCSGLNSAPPTKKYHVYPELQNVTLPGIRVFADVIKLRILSCGQPGFRVALKANDCCPYRRQKREI